MDTLSGLIATAAWPAVRRWIRTSFPDVRHTSVDDLAHLIESDTEPRPVILDTRKEKEYIVSHLPGAIWLDPVVSDDELATQWPRDQRIIAYCSIGYRSSLATRRLTALGYTQASNLEGSIFRWVVAGHCVENVNGRARVVHPYNRLWGLLLPEGLRAPHAR